MLTPLNTTLSAVYEISKKNQTNKKTEVVTSYRLETGATGDFDESIQFFFFWLNIRNDLITLIMQSGSWF